MRVCLAVQHRPRDHGGSRMIGHLGVNFGQQDPMSTVLSAYAAWSFTRIPEAEPVRTGSPLRVTSFPKAKRTERRAKNKSARKARRTTR